MLWTNCQDLSSIQRLMNQKTQF